MGGKGGGAWKVAYADFVTAMMAFFLVMWITAQSKSVKQAIAEYFSEPAGMSKNPSGVSSRTSGATSLFPTKRSGDASYVKGGKGAMGRGDGATDLDVEAYADETNTELNTKRPNLFIMHKGVRSMMGATVQFSEASVELDEWAKERLKAASIMFRGKPNKIEIRGHATRRPLTYNGPQPDLWQMSYARCIATMKYLEEQGIEPERMRLSQAGAFEPYSQQSDTEAQTQNSRVDVYMVGDFVDESKTTSRRGPVKTKNQEKLHDTTAVEARLPGEPAEATPGAKAR